MSYLFVVVIGAIGGWAAGQYIKGSEMGVMPDIAAGAIGAAVIVALSRAVGLSGEMMMSAVSAIAGAIGTVIVMRQVLKPKPVLVTKSRRRR